MLYLVTGCAGFIGWKVTEKLLERGNQVVGLDNMNDYYDPRLKEWRLGTLKHFNGFTFRPDDITDMPKMEELFRQNTFNAVINLAARAGVRASVEDPWTYYETNVKGVLNLLECCRRANVKKFVQASSSSVYGLNEIPFRENENTDRSLSPYAASKKAAEVLCHTYHHLYALDVSIPRFFTVYGPAGRPDMGIFRFIKNIDEGKPIEVYGDGTQKRDFTYVDDIAEGTIRGLASVGYAIFNLGNSVSVELKYVINLIEENLKKKAVVRYLPRHPADVSNTWADISQALNVLDWHPKVTVEKGIALTVRWYTDHRKT